MDFTYNKRKHKGILFFSASSYADFIQLYNFGIREMLVSYFYIKKNLKSFDSILPKLKAEGGIFMTDSGAFSFMGKFNEDSDEFEKARHEEFWIPYLEEYVAWVREHKDFIFSCANLDLDKIVGRDVVRKWNKKYFEPLEKEGINVVYVAHEQEGDPNALGHFREYCSTYKYVGVNQANKDCAAKFYQMAKMYNVKVHGFAWTELGILKHYPFFSVDSVTWLGGVRFGTTYDYDGKNFRTLDYKHKYLRKAHRLKYERGGVDFSKVTTTEERININKMNLLGWLGFRVEFLKMADLKLHNKTANYYERDTRDSSEAH